MNARFYSAPDSAAGIREERQRERRQKGEFREMQKEREKERKRRKRSGDSGEMSRENEWERGGEGEKGETRKNRGIPSVLILQFKHCLKDTFRCRYWLCFFLKSPPVAVNVTDL